MTLRSTGQRITPADDVLMEAGMGVGLVGFGVELKYHRYDPLDPSPRVQDLLDYLDDRADPIFWG
jgi:Protein of unknown function (DUF3024)